MALKTMVYKDSTIRKFGLWTSEIWKMYIQRQISTLLESLGQKMNNPTPYQNISFY